MSDSLFKSTQQMPVDGNKDVIRTAMTDFEKKGDPIILGEKVFTSYDVDNLPPPNRGHRY